jgi:hypothetical protein
MHASVVMQQAEEESRKKYTDLPVPELRYLHMS